VESGGEEGGLEGACDPGALVRMTGIDRRAGAHPGGSVREARGQEGYTVICAPGVHIWIRDYSLKPEDE
jgi:hypothetical protein